MEAAMTTKTELALADQSVGDIMLNAPLLAQIDQMALRMSKGRATVPKHLQDNEGDCWAIIMQALQWKMNPFVVAQKTHVVSGTLGYEAQLVLAVVEASGAIEGHFHYQYDGEGNTLRCRVGAILRGDKDITWNEWLCISSVKVKNSPLWQTNPKQQMGYLQGKNFCRAYAPGAILGIYTPDELHDFPVTEREIAPTAKVSSIMDNLKLAKARESAVDIEDVTDAVIEDSEQATQPADDQKPQTFADIAALINQAGSEEALSNAVETLTNFLATDGNEQYADELRSLYSVRKKALKAK